MARSRGRWLVAVVVTAALVASALVARRGARQWWWDGLATRPPTPEEESALAACGEVGWPAALKLLVLDRDTPCGEGWAVSALAGHARGGDQAAWLAERVVAPETAEGARLRAAWALAVAGRTPPVEPAWLRLRVSEPRRAATREALFDPALAAHLGPAGVALGVAERAARAEATAEEALPAVRWLATLGEPEAEAAAQRAIAALTGVDAATAEALRSRRSRGASLAGHGAPARASLARRGCPEPHRCAAALLPALESMVAESAAARGEPVGPPPPLDPTLDAFLAAIGWGATERAAADWQRDALARWVDGHPERLRSLWTRGGEGTTLRLGWDGAGTPFLSAVVLQRLGAGSVRSDRPDAAWLSVDGRWAARTCGAVGLEPPATDRTQPETWARAALEAGAARVAAALDPALPPPAGGDPVARAIGAGLRASDGARDASAAPGRALEGLCRP
jgi:hypothetical protein